MSRTQKSKDPRKERTHNKPNPYGICHCSQCTIARRGGSDATIIKVKRKQKRAWKSNKPEQRGAYPG